MCLPQDKFSIILNSPSSYFKLCSLITYAYIWQNACMECMLSYGVFLRSSWTLWQSVLFFSKALQSFTPLSINHFGFRISLHKADLKSLLTEKFVAGAQKLDLELQKSCVLISSADSYTHFWLALLFHVFCWRSLALNCSLGSAETLQVHKST